MKMSGSINCLNLAVVNACSILIRYVCVIIGGHHHDASTAVNVHHVGFNADTKFPEHLDAGDFTCASPTRKTKTL